MPKYREKHHIYIGSQKWLKVTTESYKVHVLQVIYLENNTMYKFDPELPGIITSKHTNDHTHNFLFYFL